MVFRGLRSALHLVLAVSLLNLTACHIYVPTGVGRLERPDRVRVHLAVPGQFELLDLTAKDVTVVDGEVVRWDEETLVLSVWWLESRYGLEFRGQGETIVVRREHINHIEERKISVLNTAVLIGLFTAAMAVGVGALASAGASGNGSGPDDPPQ